MRKAFSLLLAMLFAAAVMAQTVDTQAIGYGASATGGGNATPTLVTSVSALETALTSSGSAVIIITKSLTFTEVLSVKAVNKTLLALPGVKLTSNQQNKDNSGILFFKKGSKNLILRNLTFVSPGAYDCDGWDNLCFEDVTNAWVDHCDFQDGVDGNFDNKGTTDNITVSWCRFRYLKAPKAGGSGGSDDHRYSNLLGSSTSDQPADGTYSMTWAYCWWDEGCVERMLRCRNASLHFLNCYWNSSVANYYIGPQNADCYIEGCYFAGAPASSNIFYQNYGGTNGVKFVNSYAVKGLPSNVTDRTVTKPSYSYTALPYSQVVSKLTDASCGAGATLQVTTAGVISSSCSGDEPVTPTEDPVVSPTDTTTTPVDTLGAWWNFSDADFSSLATLSAPKIIRHLVIAATSENIVVADANAKTLDGYSFTSRIKMGGAGTKVSRYFGFYVAGPCTIQTYSIASSSSASRNLQLACDSFPNVIGTVVVGGSAISKQTFQYTGSATNLFLYSESGGINFYGIRMTGAKVGPQTTPTGCSNLPATKSVEKFMKDGCVYIRRNGEVYTATGLRVQ